MTQHHNVSPTNIVESRSYAIGRQLSRIFHPITMNMLTFLLAGYFGLEQPKGLAWAVACILTLVIPPTAFYTIRLRQGAYGDEDVSIRQQRNELYVFGFVWLVVASAALIPLGLPYALLAVLVVALTQGVIGGIINLFWKISVHAASVATAATVAIVYMRTLGIILWICAVAVGWARVRTNNHTPLQVLMGFLIAATTVFVVFQFFGIRS
jgi:membrane-associated phospholipid phosphatase